MPSARLLLPLVLLGSSALSAQFPGSSNSLMIQNVHPVDERTGRVEVGLDGDLPVLDGHPLENPAVPQDPLMAASNGRVAVNRVESDRKP